MHDPVVAIPLGGSMPVLLEGDQSNPAGVAGEGVPVQFTPKPFVRPSKQIKGEHIDYEPDPFDVDGNVKAGYVPPPPVETNPSPVPTPVPSAPYSGYVQVATPLPTSQVAAPPVVAESRGLDAYLSAETEGSVPAESYVPGSGAPAPGTRWKAIVEGSTKRVAYHFEVADPPVYETRGGTFFRVHNGVESERRYEAQPGYVASNQILLMFPADLNPQQPRFSRGG